jgi:hypothetical protein
MVLPSAPMRKTKHLTATGNPSRASPSRSGSTQTTSPYPQKLTCASDGRKESLDLDLQWRSACTEDKPSPTLMLRVRPTACRRTSSASTHEKITGTLSRWRFCFRGCQWPASFTPVTSGPPTDSGFPAFSQMICKFYPSNKNAARGRTPPGGRKIVLLGERADRPKGWAAAGVGGSGPRP